MQLVLTGIKCARICGEIVFRILQLSSALVVVQLYHLLRVVGGGAITKWINEWLRTGWWLVLQSGLITARTIKHTTTATSQQQIGLLLRV